MADHVRLGELLVDARAITRQQLDQALEFQKRDGRRLGTLLAELGFVTETQVTQILSQQLSVPWVSLYHIDFSRPLLDLVPREVAERYCLLPIFVRRVRGVGETLYVAMDDPSDERARAEVAQYAGLPVRAMIAAPSDIAAAIRAYYGRPSQVPARLPRRGAAAGGPGPVAPATPPAAPAAVTPPPRAEERSALPATPVGGEGAGSPRARPPGAAPDESGRAGDPAAPSPPMIAGSRGVEVHDEPSPDSGVPIPAREPSMPRPRHGMRGKRITLTLLDGTRVTLPARAAPAASMAGNAPAGADDATASSLTARDLVSALRAVGHGADASAVLDDVARWETLFAALLSLLLRKHLIADWEFVEELESMRKR